MAGSVGVGTRRQRAGAVLECRLSGGFELSGGLGFVTAALVLEGPEEAVTALLIAAPVERG